MLVERTFVLAHTQTVVLTPICVDDRLWSRIRQCGRTSGTL